MPQGGGPISRPSRATARNPLLTTGPRSPENVRVRREKTRGATATLAVAPGGQVFSTRTGEDDRKAEIRPNASLAGSFSASSASAKIRPEAVNHWGRGV
jgi:hypothetical protein